MSKKARILLIDANPKYENRREGKLIKEFLDILEVKAEHKRARSKSHLLKILELTTCPYIHISAHGSREGIETSRGNVTVDDIIELKQRRKGKRRAKFVFCSACQTGSTKLAEAFQESLCKEYLAPKRDAYWTEVALTSLILYHALFHDKLTLNGAMNRAFKKFQTRGDWYIYTE